LPFKIEKNNIKGLKKTKTKIMMNIGEPELAFSNSFIPSAGVGLARLEFIINNYIKIHPLALVNYKKIKDAKIKKAIDDLTFTYSNKTEYLLIV
jgi:pyruvate,water dikinase